MRIYVLGFDTRYFTAAGLQFMAELRSLGCEVTWEKEVRTPQLEANIAQSDALVTIADKGWTSSVYWMEHTTVARSTPSFLYPAEPCSYSIVLGTPGLLLLDADPRTAAFQVQAAVPRE
jgi:hypothetical protein